MLLSDRGQDALLALGVFLLESGGQCRDALVPYLVAVEKGLARATVQDRKGAKMQRELKITFIFML